MKPDHLQFLIGRVEGALIALNAPQLILDSFNAVVMQFNNALPERREPSSRISDADKAELRARLDAQEQSPPVAAIASGLGISEEQLADDMAQASYADDPPPPTGEKPTAPEAHPESTGRRWPQWQKDKLIEMKRAGASTAAIERAIGRSEKQINVMYACLRKQDPAVASIPKRPRGPGRRRGSWGFTGRAPEAPPPGEIITYTDEHGRTVKQCPTAYASGVFPERSARPKGGA